MPATRLPPALPRAVAAAATVVPDTIHITMRTSRQVTLTLPNRTLSRRAADGEVAKIDEAPDCGKVSSGRR